MPFSYEAGGVCQHMVVEVYLPKNLRNQGALIDLLGNVVEFHAAKKWLVEHSSELYGAPVELVPLRPSLKALLADGRGDAIGEALREYGVYIDEDITVEEASGFYWLCDGLRRPYCVAKDTLVLYRASMWQEYFPTSEDFRARLDEMSQTIEGYSIYEVDGAFKNTHAVKPVPVPVSRGGRARTASRTLVTALRRGDAAKVLSCLEKLGLPVGGGLFNLIDPIHMKGKKLPQSLIEAFRSNAFALTEEARVEPRGDGWLLSDRGLRAGEKALYLLEPQDSYLSVRCCLSSPAGASAEQESWQIDTGSMCYLVETTFDAVILSRLLSMVEERTSVIRFIVSLGLGPDLPPIEAAGHGGSLGKGKREALCNARKVIWDTLTLVGQYFAYQLGKAVGMEDEIWITYYFGHLWRWQKGKLLRSDFCRPAKEMDMHSDAVIYNGRGET